VGVGDYNLDGNLDIFKTHFADDTNILYRNNGKASFDDMTIRAGLGVETRFVGWGAGIVDLDNDGNPDILIVAGNVNPELERVHAKYPWRCPRVVYRNLGNGAFAELEAHPIGIAAGDAAAGVDDRGLAGARRARKAPAQAAGLEQPLSLGALPDPHERTAQFRLSPLAAGAIEPGRAGGHDGHCRARSTSPRGQTGSSTGA